MQKQSRSFSRVLTQNYQFYISPRDASALPLYDGLYVGVIKLLIQPVVINHARHF